MRKQSGDQRESVEGLDNNEDEYVANAYTCLQGILMGTEELIQMKICRCIISLFCQYMIRFQGGPKFHFVI